LVVQGYKSSAVVDTNTTPIKTTSSRFRAALHCNEARTSYA
jgi:hypothetical protein